MFVQYRAEGISWVKGSVCFVLKFALPPFSPPPLSGVQISKQNMHGTFDPINNLNPVLSFFDLPADPPLPFPPPVLPPLPPGLGPSVDKGIDIALQHMHQSTTLFGTALFILRVANE